MQRRFFRARRASKCSSLPPHLLARRARYGYGVLPSTLARRARYGVLGMACSGARRASKCSSLPPHLLARRARLGMRRARYAGMTDAILVRRAQVWSELDQTNVRRRIFDDVGEPRPIIRPRKTRLQPFSRKNLPPRSHVPTFPRSAWEREQRGLPVHA